MALYRQLKYTSSTANSEFVVVKGCLMYTTYKYLLQPQIIQDPTLLPCNQSSHQLLQPQILQDPTLLPRNQSSHQAYIYQAYIGENISAKPSSPLQNVLASLVDLDSRS